MMSRVPLPPRPWLGTGLVAVRVRPAPVSPRPRPTRGSARSRRPPATRRIPAQQPVQPVHSALTTPQPTAGPDLNNRNEVALAMAAQIAQMVGDR
jgi:hypothetical protein